MSRVAIAFVIAAGCGDAGVVAPAAAKTSVEQLAKITDAMTSGNGADGVAATIAMIEADVAIVTHQGTAVSVPFPSMYVTDNTTCTPGSCMFDANSNSDVLTQTLSGYIARDGDRDDISLHATDGYCQYRLGSVEAWNLDGTVIANETGVDGSIAIRVSETQGCGIAGTPTREITIDYQAVVLDAQGCPVGGSVHATNAYFDLYTDDGDASYDVAGTASFGSTCDAL